MVQVRVEVTAKIKVLVANQATARKVTKVSRPLGTHPDPTEGLPR